MKYFVSYTTRDKEVTVDLLKSLSRLLERDGDVFIDIINNDSLDKQKRVITELDDCDILVLLETENVYSSTWVSYELERAFKNNIPIKKIRISDILVNPMM